MVLLFNKKHYFLYFIIGLLLCAKHEQLFNLDRRKLHWQLLKLKERKEKRESGSLSVTRE